MQVISLWKIVVIVAAFKLAAGTATTNLLQQHTQTNMLVDPSGASGVRWVIQSTAQPTRGPVPLWVGIRKGGSGNWAASTYLA